VNLKPRPAIAVVAIALAASVVASLALAACRGSGGLDAQERSPRNRLIVLGNSIGGIRLNEPRRRVEKVFGRGSSRRRGVVSYLGGRLLVDYWFHDRLTTRVEDIETRWGGFHTRSGVHVGSSREKLRALHVPCGGGQCGLAAGRMPDAPGTGFELRHGKVAQIDIGFS
jgi:hypothetical protein